MARQLACHQPARPAELRGVEVSQLRSQHSVPEFHLAQFIGLPFRRFHEFDKMWGKYGFRPVASAGVARDYYGLPGATRDDRVRLERSFADLESRIAPVIRALADAPPGPVDLAEEDRDGLAGYTAILHVRVPAYRTPSFARAQQMARDLKNLGLTDPVAFRAGLNQLGATQTDDEIEAIRLAWIDDVASGRRGLRVHRSITFMVLRSAVEKVRPMLVDRQWELLRLQDFPGFVIGDQPVTLLQGARIAPSVGFGTPDVQVMMPLSPATLLLISNRPREAVLRVIPESDVPVKPEPWWATVNKVSWLSAARYVYAGRQDDLTQTELLLHPEYRRRSSSENK